MRWAPNNPVVVGKLLVVRFMLYSFVVGRPRTIKAVLVVKEFPFLPFSLSLSLSLSLSIYLSIYLSLTVYSHEKFDKGV